MPEDLVASLREHALRLQIVEERVSMPGRPPALFVGRIEFLHVLGPNRFDLRLPPPIVNLEVARGGARRHPEARAARDGWIVVDVRNAADLDRAKDLIAKAHAGAVRLAGT